MLSLITQARAYKFYKYRLWQAGVYPYYLVRTSRLFLDWQNRGRRQFYQSHSRTLTDLQKRLAAELEENGIATTHVDELFAGRSLVQALTHSAEESIRTNPEIHVKKTFLREFLTPNEYRDLGNPFNRWALEPLLLEVISAYFGMYARFRQLIANITIPIPEGSRASGSQRWHRDPGVGRICKVFLYLSDVDEKSGPFTYFVGSQPGGRFQNILPHRFFGKGSYYPPEGAVERTLNRLGAQSQLRVNTGRAGTVIFCNTMGLHRGGYATERKRIMITSFYKSGESSVPPELRFPANFEIHAAGLPEISRYAIAGA